VVDAKDLVTSHDQQLRENPNFPQELQPRDRQDAVNQAWVQEKAAQLNPDLLQENALANYGAPIVGDRDNFVEAGNGRTLAINRAYDQKLKTAGNYGKAVVDFAQTHNIPIPDNVKEPVLIRRRTNALEMGERVKLAREMNAETQMGNDVGETSTNDARRVQENGAMNQLNPDEGLGAKSNQSFVQQFFKGLPTGELQSLTDEKGRLNLAGDSRIKNALFRLAYSDPDLVYALTNGDLNSGVASIAKAMQTNAIRYAKLAHDTAMGRLGDGNISDALVNTLRRIDGIRDSMKSGESIVQRMRSETAQVGAGQSPEEAALMKVFARETADAKGKPKLYYSNEANVDSFLKEYANRWQGQDKTTADMFADPNEKAFAKADAILAADAAVRGAKPETAPREQPLSMFDEPVNSATNRANAEQQAPNAPNAPEQDQYQAKKAQIQQDRAQSVANIADSVSKIADVIKKPTTLGSGLGGASDAVEAAIKEYHTLVTNLGNYAASYFKEGAVTFEQFRDKLLADPIITKLLEAQGLKPNAMLASDIWRGAKANYPEIKSPGDPEIDTKTGDYLPEYSSIANYSSTPQIADALVSKMADLATENRLTSARGGFESKPIATSAENAAKIVKSLGPQTLAKLKAMGVSPDEIVHVFKQQQEHYAREFLRLGEEIATGKGKGEDTTELELKRDMAGELMKANLQGAAGNLTEAGRALRNARAINELATVHTPLAEDYRAHWLTHNKIDPKEGATWADSVPDEVAVSKDPKDRIIPGLEPSVAEAKASALAKTDRDLADAKTSARDPDKWWPFRTTRLKEALGFNAEEQALFQQGLDKIKAGQARQGKQTKLFMGLDPISPLIHDLTSDPETIEGLKIWGKLLISRGARSVADFKSFLNEHMDTSDFSDKDIEEGFKQAQAESPSKTEAPTKSEGKAASGKATPEEAARLKARRAAAKESSTKGTSIIGGDAETPVKGKGKAESKPMTAAELHALSEKFSVEPDEDEEDETGTRSSGPLMMRGETGQMIPIPEDTRLGVPKRPYEGRLLTDSTGQVRSGEAPPPITAPVARVPDITLASGVDANAPSFGPVDVKGSTEQPKLVRPTDFNAPPPVTGGGGESELRYGPENIANKPGSTLTGTGDAITRAKEGQTSFSTGEEQRVGSTATGTLGKDAEMDINAKTGQVTTKGELVDKSGPQKIFLSNQAEGVQSRLQESYRPPTTKDRLPNTVALLKELGGYVYSNGADYKDFYRWAIKMNSLVGRRIAGADLTSAWNGMKELAGQKALVEKDYLAEALKKAYNALGVSDGQKAMDRINKIPKDLPVPEKNAAYAKILSEYGRPSTLARGWDALTSVPRGLLTMFHVGAFGLQGAIGTTANLNHALMHQPLFEQLKSSGISKPEAAKQAFAKSPLISLFKAFGNKAFAEQVLNETANRPMGALGRKFGLAETGVHNLSHEVRGEGFESHLLRDWADKAYGKGLLNPLNVMGKMVENGHQGFSVYLNMLRASIFDHRATTEMSRGYTPEADPERFKQIAHWVNTITGHGNIDPRSPLGKALPALREIAWSPSYQKATIDALGSPFRLMGAGVTDLAPGLKSGSLGPALNVEGRVLPSKADLQRFKAGLRGTEAFRDMGGPRHYMARDMALWTSAGIGMLGAMNAMGANINWNDPKRSDWLQAKFGNTHVEVFGPMTAYLRLGIVSLLGLAQQQNMETFSGKGYNWAERKPGQETALDVASHFALGKAAPAVKNTLEMVGGQDAMGNQKFVYPGGKLAPITTPFTSGGKDWGPTMQGLSDVGSNFLPMSPYSVYEGAKNAGSEGPGLAAGLNAINMIGGRVHTSNMAKPEVRVKRF